MNKEERSKLLSTLVINKGISEEKYIYLLDRGLIDLPETFFYLEKDYEGYGDREFKEYKFIDVVIDNNLYRLSEYLLKKGIEPDKGLDWAIESISFKMIAQVLEYTTFSLNFEKAVDTSCKICSCNHNFIQYEADSSLGLDLALEALDYSMFRDYKEAFNKLKNYIGDLSNLRDVVEYEDTAISLEERIEFYESSVKIPIEKQNFLFILEESDLEVIKDVINKRASFTAEELIGALDLPANLFSKVLNKTDKEKIEKDLSSDYSVLLTNLAFDLETKDTAAKAVQLRRAVPSTEEKLKEKLLEVGKLDIFEREIRKFIKKKKRSI